MRRSLSDPRLRLSRIRGRERAHEIDGSQAPLHPAKTAQVFKKSEGIRKLRLFFSPPKNVGETGGRGGGINRYSTTAERRALNLPPPPLSFSHWIYYFGVVAPPPPFLKRKGRKIWEKK